MIIDVAYDEGIVCSSICVVLAWLILIFRWQMNNARILLVCLCRALSGGSGVCVVDVFAFFVECSARLDLEFTTSHSDLPYFLSLSSFISILVTYLSFITHTLSSSSEHDDTFATHAFKKHRSSPELAAFVSKLSSGLPSR